MRSRQHHLKEVEAFLLQTFADRQWDFSLPAGHGHETYFAHSGQETYFVKLGAAMVRYRAMSSLGLTPPVLAAGVLEDGTSVIVQPCITGREPARSDYHACLDQVAAIIRKMHHSPEVINTLPGAASAQYADAGAAVLVELQERWLRYREQVPEVAQFIDDGLEHLSRQIQAFQGAGLVASHNDICNANWLLTPDGDWYLVDLEAMSLDDPALDIGATLWWYYPPRLRRRFLEIAGYGDEAGFEFRMRVRMALHCLHIILPREGSFDQFSPAAFIQRLEDFRAALAGEENPQGYD